MSSIRRAWLSAPGRPRREPPSRSARAKQVRVDTRSRSASRSGWAAAGQPMAARRATGGCFISNGKLCGAREAAPRRRGGPYLPQSGAAPARTTIVHPGWAQPLLSLATVCLKGFS